MSGIYAKDTSVSVERSRAEIETILAKYGAERFGYATEPGRAIVAFTIKDVPIGDNEGVMLAVRMTLPLPAMGEKRFTHRKRYNEIVENSPQDVAKLWEQACRSSWRSLCLVIKAKLEACASGISTIEREFLADVVTPSGMTLGEMVRPQLAAMSERGEATGKLRKCCVVCEYSGNLLIGENASGLGD